MLWLAGWQWWQGFRPGLNHPREGEHVLRHVLCTNSEMGDGGKPRGDSQRGCDSGLRPASATSTRLTPARMILWPCVVTSLSPGTWWSGTRGTEAEGLIFRYSVKLESENQSVSLLYTSHTFFHHQSRNISCDLQTSVVFSAKKEKFLFYEHPNSCFSSLCIFNIFFLGLLQDKTENWNLITVKSGSCSLSLVKWAMVHFASCSILNTAMIPLFATSCCISLTNQQHVISNIIALIMLRVFH